MPKVTDPSILAGLNGSPQGSIYALPPTPMEVSRERRAENADARAANSDARAAAAAERSAANEAARIDLARQEANKAPSGYRWNNGALEPIPGGPNDPQTLAAAQRPQITAKERADAISGYNSGAQLDRIVQQLEQQYAAGPGSTTGISGLRDYLPTAANRQFDSTANAARGIVGSALGFTGGQLNTATEAEMAVGPYLPQSGDRDEVIRDKIARLRQLAQDARVRSVAILGGTPDANGKITPTDDRRDAALPVGAQGAANGGGGPGSVWQQTYGVGPTAPGAAPAGATTQGQSIDPRMQAELDTYIQQQGRNITPQGLSQFINGLYGKYGGAPGAGLDEYASQTANALQNGGTINTNIPPQTVPLSGLDKFRNDIVSNPLGAGAVGFADAAGFGGVSALAGNDVRALGEQNPLSMAVGQIAGSIAGTQGLSALGRNTIGRAVPQALGGGARGALGRDLATDAIYSGVYGANQGQDPLLSAAVGAGGSLLGRGVGGALGGIAQGVVSPTVSRLRAQGVTPTIGQILRGRASDNGGRSLLAGVEDVIANTGGIGNVVNNARNRALEDANLAAFNRVSGQSPITDIGERGLEQLGNVSDQAYSDALSGVSLPGNDAQYIADIANARQSGAAIDAARNRGDFAYIDRSQLFPIVGNGNITGEQAQDALRLLSGQSRAYRQAANGVSPDPAAAGVADALEQTRAAITDLAGRTNPEMLPRLNEANSIYRGLNVLDDAAARAINEGGTFTGAQLNAAIKKNSGMFGGKGLRGAAKSPLYQLAQDMQAVLPNKVPPTGVNAAPALALGGAAIGATGVGTDNDWLKGLGLAALAATPYTKVGQRVLADALTVRPDAIRNAGRAISQRRGLFGTSLVPLALPLAN